MNWASIIDILIGIRRYYAHDEKTPGDTIIIIYVLLVDRPSAHYCAMISLDDLTYRSLLRALPMQIFFHIGCLRILSCVTDLTRSKLIIRYDLI